MTILNAPRTRAGMRLGLWALICAIVSPLWAWTAVVALLAESAGHDFPNEPQTPEWLAVVIYVFALVGLLVVPATFLFSIIGGIAAIRRNRKPGVVLGIIALAVSVISVGFVVAFLGATFIQVFAPFG
ncbi:MAG: hypothetical protein ABJA94_07850 [Rhodoglobus sp.]